MCKMVVLSFEISFSLISDYDFGRVLVFIGIFWVVSDR